MDLAIILYLGLGLAAGTLSGLIGIGGGILIVPTLVFLFKFSQQEAQGTSLAMMIPPIGLLAVWTYYQQGYVNLKVAVLMCIGFVIGGLLGAKIALAIPKEMLGRVFGVALILVGVKMVSGK
ncbi:MAG: sulfite exporter TauE/SafE family protein [Gloeocapsa sp. DLM2.Bin57]|nr:MAG: sulfite exporter TauE/SafE family protein [Gloeocapsa sp. DLM2.Bin57]